MALQKAIPTDFGVDAGYWNIGASQEDFKHGGVQITLYGYLDVAARQAGKQPLSKADFILTGADYTPDGNRAAWYEVLKTKPEFSGAVDC